VAPSVGEHSIIVSRLRFRSFKKLEEIKEKKFIEEDLKIEPKGVLSTEIKWLPATTERSDFDKSKNYALLQVFIDSVRKISGKYEPFVEITISPFVDQKKTSTAVVKEDVATYEKYFHFFIKNPNSDVMTVRVFDKNTMNSVAFFTYNINDLFTRNSMEHEMQAFPLISSSDSEVIMAMKLNILKDE
jgi:hypothetical protein